MLCLEDLERSASDNRGDVGPLRVHWWAGTVCSMSPLSRNQMAPHGGDQCTHWGYVQPTYIEDLPFRLDFNTVSF